MADGKLTGIDSKGSAPATLPSGLEDFSFVARSSTAQGKPHASCYVAIDGVEFEGRDYAWSSDVLQLADQWSCIVPAPEGKAVTTDGKRVPVKDIKVGAKVQFYTTDPEVEGGAKLLKITGRLTDIDDGNDPQSGYYLRLSGYDLGWHLTTGCGPVHFNLRGCTFKTLLEKLVMDPALKWGFQGVNSGNLGNLKVRMGPRAAIEAAKFLGVKDSGTPSPGAKLPPFQIEIGEAIGPRIVELAKWQRYLVNVSADGYLQFFQPTNASTPFYYFHHETAGEERQGFPLNNIRSSTLRQSAAGLYTITENWTTVVNPPANADTDDPNRGTYEGHYEDAALLPFVRRKTYSDPNQIGKAKASKRAKWSHDRGVFDSWEYRLRVKGHSQDGIPYEPNTIASLRDTVRGIEGIYYVQSVRPSRILPQGGVSSDAGTFTDIVLRKPGLLSA